MLHVYVCVLYVCILEFHAYIELMLEFRAYILYLLYILSLETFLYHFAAYWSPFVTIYKSVFCCCCCC